MQKESKRRVYLFEMLYVREVYGGLRDGVVWLVASEVRVVRFTYMYDSTLYEVESASERTSLLYWLTTILVQLCPLVYFDALFRIVRRPNVDSRICRMRRWERRSGRQRDQIILVLWPASLVPAETLLRLLCSAFDEITR